MSRPLRIQYPGAWYHVMNRGRRREVIFPAKEDYLAFIEVLKETVSLRNIKLAAYCLMPNHYKVEIASLCGIRRGIINEPRNVAIYLTRCLRRDSLKEIGEEFKVRNYSSVSSIIESMKANLASNKKLKKQVDKIKRDLQLSQKQT